MSHYQKQTDTMDVEPFVHYYSLPNFKNDMPEIQPDKWVGEWPRTSLWQMLFIGYNYSPVGIQTQYVIYQKQTDTMGVEPFLHSPVVQLTKFPIIKKKKNSLNFPSRSHYRNLLPFYRLQPQFQPFRFYICFYSGKTYF